MIFNVDGPDTRIFERETPRIRGSLSACHGGRGRSRGVPSRRFEVESYDPLILGAITFIESNIHRSLTVQDIAAHAGLCVSEFARRFRGSVGRSPKQIIISIRMRRAAMLLCDTELSPKEIALIVGVRWIGSFGRMFRAVYGVPPAAYRLQRRAQRSEKPVR